MLDDRIATPSGADRAILHRFECLVVKPIALAAYKRCSCIRERTAIVVAAHRLPPVPRFVQARQMVRLCRNGCELGFSTYSKVDLMRSSCGFAPNQVAMTLRRRGVCSPRVFSLQLFGFRLFALAWFAGCVIGQLVTAERRYPAYLTNQDMQVARLVQPARSRCVVFRFLIVLYFAWTLMVTVKEW